MVGLKTADALEVCQNVRRTISHLYITQLLKLELLCLFLYLLIGRPMWANLLSSIVLRAIRGIVHDEPGVTRDRTYVSAFCAITFLVVDTGGLVTMTRNFYH